MTRTELALNTQAELSLKPDESVTVLIAVGAGDNKVVVTSALPLPYTALEILAPDQVEAKAKGTKIANPVGRGNVCTDRIGAEFPGCVAFWQGGHWGQDKNWGAVVTNKLAQPIKAILKLSGSQVHDMDCWSYPEHINGGPLVIWTKCKVGMRGDFSPRTVAGLMAPKAFTERKRLWGHDSRMRLGGEVA